MTKKENILGRAAVALFCVTVLVSGGLAGYGLVTQGEPPQVKIADDLRQLTFADRWVICGDPLICAYADRNIPPEVVNVAYRQHPDLTLEDIEKAISEYNITIVVLSYRLAKMDGLGLLLREHNFTVIRPWRAPGWNPDWQNYHAALDFFQDDMGSVTIWWRGTLHIA